MATTSKQTILALASVGIDIGKDVFWSTPTELVHRYS
jgi:hypothetical protein